MFNNQDFFTTLWKLFIKKRREQCLSPPFTHACALRYGSITCSGVIAIRGFKSGGGKPMEKAPWNVMIRS
jgi:hypothetical protein